MPDRGPGSSSDRLDGALSLIDEANADDPVHVDTTSGPRPRGVVQGELASEWVTRLDPAASELQLIAARAHHLRRWEVARSSYPEGRAGYLRWRADQKARHASLVADLLVDAGYEPGEIARVQAIIRKEHLRTDPEVQTHEDALCLVFLREELAAFVAQHGDHKTIEVIRKTATKMSPAGLRAVADLGLPTASSALISAALEG